MKKKSNVTVRFYQDTIELQFTTELAQIYLANKASWKFQKKVAYLVSPSTPCSTLLMNNFKIVCVLALKALTHVYYNLCLRSGPMVQQYYTISIHQLLLHNSFFITLSL